MILLILIAASFSLGFTQGAPVGTPDNAFAKSNGNGWQCDRGYREVGHACVADRAEDRASQDVCCDLKSGPVTDTTQLEQENARLRLQVKALSLKNSVLRSERDDDP